MCRFDVAYVSDLRPFHIQGFEYQVATTRLQRYVTEPHRTKILDVRLVSLNPIDCGAYQRRVMRLGDFLLNEGLANAEFSQLILYLTLHTCSE